MKYTAFILSLTLMATIALAPQAKAEEFSAEQKAEINKMFEAYLLGNGGKILESVNTYQATLQEEAQAQASSLAKEFMSKIDTRTDLPVAGNPDGDVTVVEFFDYNCGYCSRALDELQTVLKTDKNIKVVFIEMPILGPNSFEAAKWSLAAAEQDKYWEYHQAVMEHKGQKDAPTLEKIAKDLGLDVKKLKADKESKEITEALNNNIAEAQSMNIRGTPGFIIGSELTPGFIPAAEIKKIIAAERAKQG